MFLNKILSIKNWKDFFELRNFFSDLKTLDFDEDTYVSNVKTGIKKLGGMF